MAGRIRQSDIDEVKARINIADLVGEHVALKPAGVGSLKGLCPFHDERSPSFHVRPQVGYYHCFGCGESGDVLSFLQRHEHVGFTEAVERLAQRIGFELHYEDGGAAVDRGNRLRLLAANAAAQEYFAEQLQSPGAEPGRRFLGERAFGVDAALRFGVGFAPAGWSNLTDHLRGRGFTEAELSAAGLVSTGERGRIYDRFRGRVVWPIHDVTGQTLGFGARRLLDDDPGPKYLNTPETPVYHKAQVLYGLDLAKRDIARQGRVVVVEGYTDVMACHLAGVTTAVATCGTSFGSDHISALRRIMGDDSARGEVVFTFDPDSAGQKAALRAFAEEKRFSAQTYVAVGPEGLDPCDLRLAHGDEAVRGMVDTKRPLFEFVIRQILTRFDLDAVEGRVGALQAAAPIIADIRDPSLRPGYMRELARMLGADLGEVQAAVRAAGGTASAPVTEKGVSRDRVPAITNVPAAAAPAATLADLPADPVTRLERDALMALLQHPELVPADLASEALHTRFANPVLAVVRDALAANLGSHEQPGWLGVVVDHAPEACRTLVRQLAVAPLPERSEAELPVYATAVAQALVERDLVRRKAELLGRLQRSDPADAALRRVLSEELVAIEARRRSVREG